MKPGKRKATFKSIRKRFILGLAVVVGSILVVFSGIAIIYNTQSLEERLRSRLNTLINLSVTGLSSALWQYNYDYVEDYIDSLFSYGDVVFVTVVTDNNKTITKTHNGIQNQDLEPVTSDSQLMWREADIRYNDVVIGHIKIALSRRRIDTLIVENSVLAIMLLFLLLSGILLTVFGLSKKYIFEPLELLEHFAHSISEGRLDSQLEIDTKDEMGRLAHSFNQMATRLKSIMASRDELEEEITERKRAEEALRNSEQLLNEMGRMAKIGGWEHDLITRQASWTKEIYRIVEIESDPIPGPDEHLAYYPPEDRRLLETAYLRAIQTGEKFDLELRCTTIKGRPLWVRAKGRPEFENGVCVKMRGTFQDITERKKTETEKEQLQSQLAQARKMEAIGTLAGGIAHDFNNILSAILGYTELALTDIPDGVEAKECLEQVLKSAVRAKNLVRQILSFSRPGTQERKPIALGPIIEETIKLLRATLPATIEIVPDMKSEVGTVLADPTQIHQLLINLCTNAAHAMRERGGILTVGLETVVPDKTVLAAQAELKPEPYERMTVTDTGEGMDPATLERIFEPFFTTKEVGQGTGMGLAMVHGIVKAHGGAVEVRSEPGKGSTFQIYLPLTEAHAEEAESAQPAPSPVGVEHILLVDDEESVMHIEKRMLERLGYKVTADTSSTRALEVFKSGPNDFDLVLTDQTMPQMTGLDLAQRLFDIRSDIPVIICTGYSTEISPESIGETGIKRVLMKPLAIREVAEAVRRVLDNHNSRQAVST